MYLSRHRRAAAFGLWGLAATTLLGCFDSRRFAFVDVAPNQPAPDAGAAVASADPGLGGALEPVEPLATSAPGSEGIGSGTSLEPAAAAPGGVSLDAGVAVADELCALPATDLPGAVLYGGAPLDGVCPANLDAPYGTSWFAYQDSADPLAVTPLAPGCDPASCALRVVGPAAGNPGYSAYGAGLALPLAPGDVPVDLSRFTGVQFWARGTLSGTRGVGGSDAPQTLFFKLVTSTQRNGDDFGVYCTIDPNAWTACRADLVGFAREGFAAPDPATDAFDPQNALRFELEFRLFRDALGAVPVPVSVAIELAQISLF